MTKGNLLIVDDEPLLLKRLRMNLEEYADHVFTATNGIEALELLNKEEIHCVICDVNMPGMNGIEVIKKIRSDNNMVPFVFYTGHGNHEMMLEVAKYGAFDFFNKPNFEGLEKVIARGLSEGFTRASPAESTEDLMNEYQKLLNELEKN
jgi:DNA-binding NtrC family response regulator